MLSLFAITAAVTERSLLSVAELRAAVGASDGSADAALLALGRQASTAIASKCCIRDDGTNPPTLLRETVVETFRWSACGPLELSRRPVASITSVTLDGATVDASVYELAGRYLHYLISGDPSDWPAGRIVVTYVAGYATAPDSLKLAATKLVTALNAEVARDPRLKGESIPGVRDVEHWVAPSDDPLLTKEIDDLIAPYVERWI